MAPYLSIFGFSVQAYPLFILVAVSVGLWLAARQARRLGLEADHVYNLGFYALLATLVGARLAFVVGNWSVYRDAPLSALSPTPTAFAWPEGAVIGGLVALIYGLRYRLPAGLTVDAVAPGLALAMAIERLGAFLGGINFGEVTSLPWGVFMWGQVRHPVQMYEMLALLAILAILLWQSFGELPGPPSRTGRTWPFDGYTFTLFVALYAGSRLFLEAFRADAPLVSGGLRSVQLVALGVLLVAVWYLYRRHFSTTDAAQEAEPEAS
jgi:phosphatidylglycerol:prolipoprotein diacylglycerol transferase